MGGRATIIALFCAAPLPVVAATLPISGSYGNELGCQLARTGEYNPVEGVELLTPDGLSTAVSICGFDAVTTVATGKIKVSMTCAFEGSGPEDDTKEKADISGDPTVGYTIHFTNGTSWGPLEKC